jgi:hypothetical protein
MSETEERSLLGRRCARCGAEATTDWDSFCRSCGFSLPNRPVESPGDTAGNPNQLVLPDRRMR